MRRRNCFRNFLRLHYFLFLFLVLPVATNGQLITQDVEQFWAMFDKLSQCHSRIDSLKCVDSLYIKKGTSYLKKYVKMYGITPDYYLHQIRRHPRFWAAIRPFTIPSQAEQSHIARILDTFQTILPGYNKPKVALLIGCINSGGTTSGNSVLIGTEIAACNHKVDLSEIRSSIKNSMKKDYNLMAYIAHEIVHTQQKGFPWTEILRLARNKKLSLLNTCLVEGTADFVTSEFLGMNINEKIHDYAKPHIRRLMEKVMEHQSAQPFDFRPWLYNYNEPMTEYPDLGYFIGYQLAAYFYQKEENKKKALRTLLRRGRYKTIVNTWKKGH